MAINYAAGERLRKLRPKEAWETIEDLAQHEEEEWNDPIFSQKESPDYIDATLEHELESMECRVKSLMRNEVLLEYEEDQVSLKMPILHSFEENKLEYKDEDEVEIKMMGTGMGRKAHLLEDKQILSVGVFDEVFLALRWHLEEINVTWAHLEKKRIRLRLYTESFEEIMHTERGDGVTSSK
ncbi:hypothetical protein Tco_0578996 [Tanacetum coccineum]